MPTVASQDLVLLGLLAKAPLHGYELKQLIEQGMHDIARIPAGTIYYTLKKLERRELITSSSERKGNRPERRVYAITDAGRQALTTLLSESLFADERPYYLFDIALFFHEQLEPGGLEEAIAAKLGRIAAVRDRVASYEAEHPGRWPFHLEALRRKAYLLTEAFDAWYRELQETVERRNRRASTKRPPHTEQRRTGRD